MVAIDESSATSDKDEEFTELLRHEVRLLIQFAASGSVSETAKALGGVDDRTIQRRLKEVNAKAIELTGNEEMALIEIRRGRGGIRLTQHGHELVNDLQPVDKDLRGVVARYSRKSKYLDMTVTSAGLVMFRDLIKSADLAQADIKLTAINQRTSEIHAELRSGVRRHRGTVTPCAFYSVAAQEPEPQRRQDSGPVLQLRGRPPVQVAAQRPELRVPNPARSRPFRVPELVDFVGSRADDKRTLWVLKADRFKLLAPDHLAERFNLADDDSVAIDDVLADRWFLLAPRWGAVAQFLDNTAPGYYKHGRVRDCIDLDTGLRNLELDLIPRSLNEEGGQVMVIHGVTREVKGYRQFPIKQNTRLALWALTGLFLDYFILEQCPQSEQVAWSKVWECATQRVWPQKQAPPSSTLPPSPQRRAM